MPAQVKVAASDALDGQERILEEKLGNDDAKNLARAVHANTGEIVTITPYVYDEKLGDYVLDHDGAQSHGSLPVAEDGPVEAKAVEDMSVAELKAYAGDNSIDISGLKKKDEILAAIQKHQEG